MISVRCVGLAEEDGGPGIEGRAEKDGIAGIEGRTVKEGRGVNSEVAEPPLMILHDFSIKSKRDVALQEMIGSSEAEQRKGYSTSLLFATMAGALSPHVHDWI
jgi:hypothetical protein